MSPATHRLATMTDASSSPCQSHAMVHNKEKNDNEKDDDDEQMNLLILLTLEGACGRWRRCKDSNNWWCPETCLSDKDLHCQHQWIRQWQRLLSSQTKKAIHWNNLRNARYPHWNVYHLLFSSARPQQVCCSNLRVVNALYKVWPQGLSHPDAIFGRLPLHLAVQAQAPWKILHRMIALYPSSVMHLDKHGYRPIHGLLWLLQPNNHQYGTFPQPPMWYLQDVVRLLYKAQIQWQSGLVLAGPLDQKLLESNILGPILIEVLQTHGRRMTKLCLQDMTIDCSMLQPKRLLSCCRRIKHLELRHVRGRGFVEEVLSSLALQRRRRSLERLILIDCDLRSIDFLEKFLSQTFNSTRHCFLGPPKDRTTNHFLVVDLSDNPLENVSPSQWERVLSMSNKHSVLFAGTSLPPSVLQACSIDYIVAAMNYYSNQAQVLYYLLQHRMDLLLERNM